MSNMNNSQKFQLQTKFSFLFSGRLWFVRLSTNKKKFLLCHPWFQRSSRFWARSGLYLLRQPEMISYFSKFIFLYDQIEENYLVQRSSIDFLLLEVCIYVCMSLCIRFEQTKTREKKKTRERQRSTKPPSCIGGIEWPREGHLISTYIR